MKSSFLAPKEASAEVARNFGGNASHCRIQLIWIVRKLELETAKNVSASKTEQMVEFFGHC